VPGDGTVYNETAGRFDFRRNQIAHDQVLQVASYPDLPDIPALPETLLLLDLMIQEPCVDLREMAQLVLWDLGATLQILRLAGREYGSFEQRPMRIEDCISALGLEACVDAVSARTVARGHRREAIAAFWTYSREIAKHSKLTGEELPGIDPEEAYLTGLLHGIGALPAILGWDCTEFRSVDGPGAGFLLAKRWGLPPCVVESQFELQLSGRHTQWSGIVQAAHQRAYLSSMN
jgi:HD-like signal output (HDOD) protein